MREGAFQAGTDKWGGGVRIGSGTCIKPSVQAVRYTSKGAPSNSGQSVASTSCTRLLRNAGNP